MNCPSCNKPTIVWQGGVCRRCYVAQTDYEATRAEILSDPVAKRAAEINAAERAVVEAAVAWRPIHLRRKWSEEESVAIHEMLRAIDTLIALRGNP